MTKKWPFKFINEFAKNADHKTADKLSQSLPKDVLDSLKNKAELSAHKKLKEYQEKAITKVKETFEGEIKRLNSLNENSSERNSAFDLEIEKLELEKKKLIDQIKKIQAPLDMMRVVL